MLKRTTYDRTSRKTDKINDFFKQMEIPLRRHHFNGKDPTRVLDFPALSAHEPNMQEMSKVQEFVKLLSFLKGFALSQTMP